MGYGEQDFIPCERCNAPLWDIHHMIFKSHQGHDTIDNLIGLCRLCHNKAHAGLIAWGDLAHSHLKFLEKKFGLWRK